MQRLYTTNDIVKDTGCVKATINLWVAKGWVKPCRMSGIHPETHVLLYTKAEHDRVMDAVRAAEGHTRRISTFLNRTLHEARECNAVTCAELASRCGCCDATVHKALVRLGYPKRRNVGVLEEDVGEVKAMVQKFRQEGVQKRAETRKAAVNVCPAFPPWGARESAGNGQDSTGSITLHIKGITISLDRKDAEALAEEILAQI